MLTKEDFDKACNIERQVKFFKREDGELGDVIIVRNTDTKQHYLVKEKLFTNVEEFTAELKKTMNRSSISNQNILKFYDYSSISKVDQASKTFKIRLFYDYWERSLRKEVKDRRSSGNDFSIEEMTYLYYQMIGACAYLEEKGANHGDLSPGVIFLDDSNNFVLADRLKSKARFPQNLIDKLLRKNKLYIPPEVFRAIKAKDSKALDQVNPFKSDVFSLGMVFLEVGNMVDVTDIYGLHNSDLDRGILQRHIANFDNRYSENQFICMILKKMLETDEYKRPTFGDLLNAMPELTVVKEYFNRNRGNSNNKRNHTRNEEFLKSNPQLINSVAIESNRLLNNSDNSKLQTERRVSGYGSQMQMNQIDNGAFKKVVDHKIYKEETTYYNNSQSNPLHLNPHPPSRSNSRHIANQQPVSNHNIPPMMPNPRAYVLNDKNSFMNESYLNKPTNEYQQYPDPKAKPMRNSGNDGNDPNANPMMFVMNNRGLHESSHNYFNSNNQDPNNFQNRPMLPRKPSDGNLLNLQFNSNSSDNSGRGPGARITKSNVPYRNSQYMAEISNPNIQSNHSINRSDSRSRQQTAQNSLNNGQGHSGSFIGINNMLYNSQRNPPAPPLHPANSNMRRGPVKNPPVKGPQGSTNRRNSDANGSKPGSDKRIFKIFE